MMLAPRLQQLFWPQLHMRAASGLGFGIVVGVK